MYIEWTKTPLDPNNYFSSILPSLLWSIDRYTVWRFLALMRKCSVSLSRSIWACCYFTDIVKSRCGFKSNFQRGCYKSWSNAPSTGMWVIFLIVIYNSCLEWWIYINKTRKRWYIVTKEMTDTTGKYSYRRLRTLNKITKNPLTITGRNLSKINYYLSTLFLLWIKEIMVTFITFTFLKYKLHFYSYIHGRLLS